MNLPEITIEELLESGVHFGHNVRRWNPKMEEYIFGVRNNIHIFDLRITLPLISSALTKLHEVASRSGKILFVGTKKQCSLIVKEIALESEQFYINKRWLGGTLTNWKTIRGSIRRLLDIEELQSSGRINKLSKKEAVDITKEYEKLDASVGGIKDMKGLPDALFVVDVAYEKIAVTEAKKMGIPIIALVDTNSNPEGIDHIIPGNDDAIRSIRLITKVISDACARGLASSKGGALNIQTDDEAPAIKVKKASITSGKALNLVEEAELSEPEEDLSIETEEVIEKSDEDSVETVDESTVEPEEISVESTGVSDDNVEETKEEK